MHPLFLLAFLTFLLVIGFALWSHQSNKRRQKYGKSTTGVGRDADPLS